MVTEVEVAGENGGIRFKDVSCRIKPAGDRILTAGYMDHTI